MAAHLAKRPRRSEHEVPLCRRHRPRPQRAARAADLHTHHQQRPARCCRRGHLKNTEKNLTAFCLDKPDRVYGRAYEISADGTKLEPIEIIGDREHFPDFTRIMCKPHKEDGRCVYDLDTGLHPRRDWNSIDPPPYHVVIEKQRLWLTDGKLYYTTEARLEGDVTINGAEERLHADWKVLKFCDTGREVAPFGKEAEEYGRTRNIYGSMIHTVGEDGLSYNTMHASLSALWNNWTPED